MLGIDDKLNIRPNDPDFKLFFSRLPKTFLLHFGSLSADFYNFPQKAFYNYVNLPVYWVRSTK